MAIAQSVPAAQDWMQKHPAFGYAMMAVQILLAVCSMGAGIYAAAQAGTELALNATEDSLEITEETSELAESGTNAAEDGTQVAEDGAEIAEDGTEAGEETTQETAQQTAQKSFLKALKGYLSSIQFYATLAQAATQAAGERQASCPMSPLAESRKGSRRRTRSPSQHDRAGKLHLG
ncbi:MAG: hypothetical protein R3F37_01875 [Candidatus Competibacteraceae bacterium]